MDCGRCRLEDFLARVKYIQNAEWIVADAASKISWRV